MSFLPEWKWPFRSKRQAMGLTGDIRPLASQQTAQLIDATWPEPRPILISADTTAALIGCEWTLRWGIERGVFSEATATGFNFSRVVYARYVSLSCVSLQGAGIANARAVALEANISVDAMGALILPGSPSPLIGPPLTALDFSVAVVAFPLTAVISVSNPLRRGLVVHNFSPGGSSMLIKLGSPPIISVGNRHYLLPPSASINIPGEDFAGNVFASWTAADAAGFANVAEIFT